MFDALVEKLWPESATRRQLAAGEVLFRADDQVRSLHLVTKGEVRLVRSLAHGAELTVQRAGPGAILAEASLFSVTYHCEARAVQPSHISSVPIKEVLEALEADLRLLRDWSRHLAEEVQRARARAETLSLRSTAERLNAWLALNGGLPEKGHWHQIAREIGVTPEALYRELARRRRSTTLPARGGQS